VKANGCRRVEQSCADHGVCSALGGLDEIERLLGVLPGEIHVRVIRGCDSILEPPGTHTPCIAEHRVDPALSFGASHLDTFVFAVMPPVGGGASKNVDVVSQASQGPGLIVGIGADSAKTRVGRVFVAKDCYAHSWVCGWLRGFSVAIGLASGSSRRRLGLSWISVIRSRVAVACGPWSTPDPPLPWCGREPRSVAVPLHRFGNDVWVGTSRK
jgi:hypothetical protein